MSLPPTPSALYTPATLQDHGVERLTCDCLEMSDADAAARIAHEIAAAIGASRWDDAIKWQRVRLRVNRTLARTSENIT